MDDFLQRAAAVLHFALQSTGTSTWSIDVPATLQHVFGTPTLHVTTDKQLAALDPQLQLVSPNSSLTLKIAEQLRTRGRPTHRAQLQATPDMQQLLLEARKLVEGVDLTIGTTEPRLLLRIVYRVRFEREVLEEAMLACCVDYENGTLWPAIPDISALREVLTPLPTTNLTAEHVDTALARARHWLELQLYPQKALHEAELSQLLAVEQARINAFYDALKEDSGLALGAKNEDSSATSLEDERSRLLEEQEYRYALSLAVETVSVATLLAPVTPVGTAEMPRLMQYCVLFAPAVQLPHCAMCGRAAPVALLRQQLLCSICRQVA